LKHKVLLTGIKACYTLVFPSKQKGDGFLN